MSAGAPLTAKLRVYPSPYPIPDDSDLCALLLNLVGVQPAEVLSNSLSVGKPVRRPAYG